MCFQMRHKLRALEQELQEERAAREREVEQASLRTVAALSSAAEAQVSADTAQPVRSFVPNRLIGFESDLRACAQRTPRKPRLKRHSAPPGYKSRRVVLVHGVPEARGPKKSVRGMRSQ